MPPAGMTAGSWRAGQGMTPCVVAAPDPYVGSVALAADGGLAVGSEDGGRGSVLAVDHHGRALVTWALSGVQYAVVRHVSGNWTGRVRRGSATTSPAYRENVGYQAAVALAGDGTGWVAWEGANGRVSVARRAGGARRFARPVSVGVRGSHRPVLATRADGGAVLAWVGRPTIDDVFDSGRSIEAAPVYAAVRSPSGAARRPTRLSNRRTGASEPFVERRDDRGVAARRRQLGPLRDRRP